MKKCRKCNLDKSLDDFNKRLDQKDGLDYYCRKCVSEINRTNRDKNKEVLREKKKAHYEKNKEHYSNYKREWKKNNREKINEKNRAYFKENPIQQFLNAFRGRIRKVLSKTADGRQRSSEHLGCNTNVLRNHIESQFRDGMSWDNYGEWHIDHIIPLYCAEDENEIFTLCHYSNLQPLWWYHNLKKSSKMPDDLIELGWIDLETGEFTPAPVPEAEIVE
jgi:hypothetical protein